MTNFGKRLRFLRKQKANMTQEALGKDLNLSKNTIGMYERGHREPSFKTLIDIASYFEVSIDYLLDYNPDGTHSFPALSESDQNILELKHEHPELFQYIEHATTDELKKLITILKMIR